MVQSLLSDPFPAGHRVGKLHGFERVWKVYVRKEYRLIYSFDAGAIYLLRIGHRREIYRREIPRVLLD